MEHMNQKRRKMSHDDDPMTGKNGEKSLPKAYTTSENIAACKQYAEIIKSIYGPNVSNKLVLDHLEKQAQASVPEWDMKKIPELEFQNPAVSIMIEEVKEQEKKASGGMNFVIIFCGALLERSEELLQLGFTSDSIINGYKSTLKKGIAVLKTLKYQSKHDNGEENKQCWQAEKDSALQEALKIFRNIDFNNIEKNQGKEKEKPKKYSYDFGLNLPDYPCTDSGDSIDPNTDFSNELRNFFINYNSGITPPSKENNIFNIKRDDTTSELTMIAVSKSPVSYLAFEEQANTAIKDPETMEQIYKGLKNFDKWFHKIVLNGVNVLVSFGLFDDFATFFMKEKGIMGICCQSKFDLHRICQLTNAKMVDDLMMINDDEIIGSVLIAYKEVVGEMSVAVIRTDIRDKKFRTVVVRNITDYNNDTKTLDRDRIPGGGAAEIEIIKQLTSFTNESLEERLFAKKFCDSLEIFPKTLVEVTSETNVAAIMTELYAAHSVGNKNFGVKTEVEKGEYCIMDSVKNDIFDYYDTKMWGLICSVNAVSKILKLA